MSAGWVFLVLVSTAISALINLLDSHLMMQRMPGWRAYVLICDLFMLPVSIVMLFIFPLPAGLGLAPWLAILASTLTSAVAIILILQAMKSEHVSRIAPLTAPRRCSWPPWPSCSWAKALPGSNCSVSEPWLQEPCLYHSNGMRKAERISTPALF